MKKLLLIFFLISCGPSQNEQPPDSSKPQNGRPKAEKVSEEGSSPDSSGGQAKADKATLEEGGQSDEEGSIEPPPIPLSVSVCDRTPAVQEFLIKEATPFWRMLWNYLPCEELTAEHLEEIEEINLSVEGIAELKTGDFADLPAVKILNLSSNVISNVGAGWFSELTNLENLNLSFNRINHLDPNALSGINKLKRLGLKGNKIENLPPELITHLTFLESIDLANNALRDFPENFFDGFKYLKNVNLQNNLFEGAVNCGTPPPGIDRLCKY